MAPSKRCQKPRTAHGSLLRRPIVLYASNLPAKTAVPPELEMGNNNVTLAVLVLEIENILLQWYFYFNIFAI